MASDPAFAAIRDGLLPMVERMRADRAGYIGARNLRKADFDELDGIGMLSIAVPESHGGCWRDLAMSTRPVCDLYRLLAHGDASTALAASMHSAVLIFWLATPRVDDDHQAAWDDQWDRIFAGVLAGRRWGTISSEPGSGGDHAKTRSVAVVDGDAWRISGSKHFGSGSSVTSRMLTTGVPEGETMADWFFTDALTGPWDGSTGVQLAREWDGRGMTATESHAFRFENVAAERIAWPGHREELARNTRGFGSVLFTSVVLGVVEEAVETAKRRFTDRPIADSLVRDWNDARLDLWTMQQVYEGMLRSIETGGEPGNGVRGKLACARLAESAMLRLTRVIGGSSLSAANPFGQWFEDVRALGFLRPPWGLMYDNLD